MTPLFKKDSPVLTSLSKIFERVQHDQMLVFSKSVLSDRLSGFLKGHSCTTALLKMTEDLRATLDNKEHCAAVAVDYQKHSTPCPTAFYFQSWEPMAYLCGRKQRVKIGNSYSDWRTIKHGVSQSWDHFYLIYLLMISLTLLLMLIWGYMPMIQLNTYQTAILIRQNSLHRIPLICFINGLSKIT